MNTVTKRRPLQTVANKWSRKLHRWGAILVALPLLVVIVSGLLLQVKKELTWVQPPTKVGEGRTPAISFDVILAAARSVPDAKIGSWDDVERLDVRPGKGVVKVLGASRWEVQVDASTGVVLQSAYRRSDLIESLHDGTFFHDSARAWVFLPAGLILLGLWASGLYLWALPLVVRLRRWREEQAARQPVQPGQPVHGRRRRGRVAWLSAAMVVAAALLAACVARAGDAGATEGQPRVEDELVVVQAFDEDDALLTTTSLDEAAPVVSLADAIARLPGGSVAGKGGFTSVPALRGMARGRTLVLLEGSRVMSERRAGPGLSFVPAFFVDDISVIRGPAGVLNGSDAIAGVVEASLRAPSFEPGARHEMVATLSTRGEGKQFGTMTEGASKRWAGLVGVAAQDFADHDAGGGKGRVLDTGFEGLGLLARAARAGERSLLDLTLLSNAGRDLGKADARAPSRRSSNPTEDVTYLGARWALDLGSGRLLETRASLFDSDVSTRSTVQDGVGVLTRAEDARDSARDLELRAAFGRERESVDWSVGLDMLRRFDVDAYNTVVKRQDGEFVATKEQPVRGGSRGDAGLFASTTIRLPHRLVFEAGLRSDAVRSRAPGLGERDDADWSGHAGLAWRDGSRLGLGLRAGRAFRSPGLYQLYYTGLTGRGTVTANPDLPEESSTTVEFELNGAFAHGRWEARAFRTSLSDFADRISDADDFYWISRERARTTGIELLASFNVNRKLTLEAMVQRMDGHDLESGERLNDLPPDRVTLRALGATPRFGWGGSLALARGIDEPGSEEREIGGSVLLDLQGSVKLGHGLALSGSLENILDREVLANADEHGVPLPGRSLTVTLRRAW